MCSGYISTHTYVHGCIRVVDIYQHIYMYMDYMYMDVVDIYQHIHMYMDVYV